MILFTLLVVVSCRKDDEIPYCEEFPNDCVDVREVKDYFYFNYGSWWVYEEENSGKRDSVYVIETFSDTSSYYFTTKVHSTYDDYNYRFWTNGVTGDKYKNLVEKSIRSTNVVRSKTKSGDYVGEDACFIFYPKPGLWAYTYGGHDITNNVLKIEEIYTDYTILEKNFKDVVKVSEEHTAVEEKQPTLHYYSPNIGLIKKELLDSNQIWNLIDYNIVK